MFDLLIAGRADLLSKDNYDVTKRLAGFGFFWPDCYTFAEWVHHTPRFLIAHRIAFGNMYCARPEVGVFAPERRRVWFPTPEHYYV